jgi:hypothetical protein
MTTRRRREDAAGGELVEVPAEFRMCAIDDNQAVKEALGELGRLEVDGSGFDKILRVLRPAAWRSWCIGGNRTDARRHVEVLRHGRAEAEGRIGDLKVQGKPTAEAEALIVGIDADIARHEALIAAAGTVPDQKQRLDRREAAGRVLNDAHNRVQPYRSAKLLPPPELEDALLAAEDEFNAADDDFERGRRELEAVGADVARLKGKAIAALVASCETACERLGSAALRLIGPDLDRLLRFPHRAPGELDRLRRQAEHLDEIMGRLGAAGRGMAAFWSGCGDAEVVVAARAGIKLAARPERSTRPRQPHPDREMREAY